MLQTMEIVARPGGYMRIDAVDAQRIPIRLAVDVEILQRRVQSIFSRFGPLLEGL